MSGRTARKGRTSSSGLYVIKVPQSQAGRGCITAAAQTMCIALLTTVLVTEQFCMPNTEPHLTILLSCRPSQCLTLRAPAKP